MTKFKYVSLFSGIGGFEQALNKLGGTCVLASEIDKFANQSYEVLYGEPTAGDIMKIDAKDVPDHDLLVGGFPCQAFSVAGKRLGFEDTRGTLFFEVARLAREKQPKVVLLENVKGLVGHDKGRTLDAIVQTLNDIGYTVDFEVLNSKYFGVPQNRERIFIVAVRGDLVEAEPWVIEGNTVVPKGKRRIGAYEGVKTFNFDWPEQTEVATRLRDILETEVDERYYLDEEKTAKLVAQFESSTEENNSGFSVEPFNETSDGLAYAVTTRTHACYLPRHVEKRQTNLIKETHPRYRIRKLTPLECWRLQGFSDEAHDAVKAAGISDSQRYKQAGNAVTVNVISAIGKRLLPYLTRAAVEK